MLLWDLSRGTSKPTPLAGHTTAVTSAFTPDGRHALTGDEQGEVRRWDLGIATTVAVLDGHTWSVEAIVASPDGSHVVTTSADTTARLWDLATNATVAVLAVLDVLDGHGGHGGLVEAWPEPPGG